MDKHVFLDYKFAPATDLTPQETKAWRMQLVQDDITSNNPFWSARWMAVFGVAPKLDESLLKVPWIKCERLGSTKTTAQARCLVRNSSVTHLLTQQIIFLPLNAKKK